jgi:hypothetical protein
MEDLVGRALQTFQGNGQSKSSGVISSFLPFFLKQVLPVRRINKICGKLHAMESKAFIQDRILEHLNVDYDISAVDQRRIASEGPLVVVANHPFGAVEGLILASILQVARNDVKIMANYLLGALGFKEFNDLFILVDPFERPESVRPNIKPLFEGCDRMGSGRAGFGDFSGWRSVTLLLE